MNGCRETIEWIYRDLFQYWKVTTIKSTFTLLTGYKRADNIIDLCFILNNAYNTMNHNECSQWFSLAPPSFETYVSQGRRDALDIEEDDEEEEAEE